MMQLWLKIRETMTRAKAPTSTPPVADNQSAVTDSPIQVSEEFIKSKRNLLWFTSASILLFLAGLTPSSGATGDATLPFTGMTINRKIFSILLLIYCWYIFYGFQYYASRVRVINSKKASGVQLKSEAGSDLIDLIRERLQKVEEFLSFETGKLVSLDDESFETLSAELKRLDEGAEKKMKGAQQMAARILKSRKSTKEEQAKVIERGGFGQFVDEISELQLAAEQARQHLGEARQYVEHYLKESRDRGAEQIDAQKVNEAIRGISKLEQSFTELSDQINGVDRFKFTYYDVRTGYAMLSFATICTIVGLMDNWIKAISKLLA